MLRISSGWRPEARFMSKRIYGRWMLDLASSEVCRRSTSFLREVACAERVPEEHANFLAALQLAHFAFVERAFDAEAVEQNAGVGFGSVAAFFADDAFEFAEAHAVGVGEVVVGLGVEGVALLESVPENLVAHHYRVDDTEIVEGELILAEDAHLFGGSDRAFGGFEFAGENFHEGRFAGAIGAGDGVAAAGHEGAGDVLKEGARAEAHRDVIHREHNLSIVP